MYISYVYTAELEFLLELGFSAKLKEKTLTSFPLLFPSYTKEKSKMQSSSLCTNINNSTEDQ